MNRHKIIFVFLSLLSYCSCEISYEKKNKLLNGFIDLFNNLPNQIYSCDEGYLRNAQQSTEQNSFEVEITLKVSEHHNLDTTKYLRCTGKIVDLEDVGISILNHHCEETTLDDKDKEIEDSTTETIGDAAETTIVREPIQLDNEVQTDTSITSGEQFIAIPREEQKVHCIGCASHVNPDAPGVSELAALGVRQLDTLEPNTHHTLNSVVDVERQVQVVNGIRYILTLVIDFNSCVTPETETCLYSKTCKISVLEKPWMKLLDGSKYRAILTNNCTEEWQFGDNGVVISKTPTDNRENNNINTLQTDGSDIIKPVINADVQSKPFTEKTLTDDDIKDIQQQIIPYNKFDGDGNEATLTTPSETAKSVEQEENKEHVVKLESASHSSPNAIPVINPVKIENLSDDKKKAIDDMMNFFEFAGLNSARPDEDNTRHKRSYDKDLNIMNLVENFQKVKKHVENAKYIYELAQIVVDHLNEIDSQVKNRVLNDVINAEEESDNHKKFYYIQSRVVTPCDDPKCDENAVPKICNAALDGTNKQVLILNVFCYDEPKNKPFGKVNSVPLNDPILLNLVQEAANKIESESTYGKAMTINRIINANTIRVSGSLTKFSVMLDHTNCDKTVSSALRSNCLIEEKLGSEICEVTVYEKYQPKDKTIAYTCTKRPIGTSFSDIRNLGLKKSVNDFTILNMVEEALQYLNKQSNINSKQIAVKVNSVTTQLVAGFLTDIELVVGYTVCKNDVQQDISECKLLENVPLRTCNAKVWDRTWIEDEKQLDVSCKEFNIEDNEFPEKQKRDLNFVGGPVIEDVNSTKIKELTKEALRKYLQKSVYHRHFEIIDILQATVQVVAGTLTNIEFKISPTTCLIDKEGNPPSNSDCKIYDSNDVTTCTALIWEKEWLEFKEINTTCKFDNDNTKIKRQITGAPLEQNPNDPEYKKLAEESMLKYLQNTGNTIPHTVLDIEKVTTQIVAGTRTVINFKISPVSQSTGDVISCVSNIWEKPWKHFKEIDVNCGIENYSINKRQFTLVPMNPNFKKLTEESMQLYLNKSSNTTPHKVVKIEKVVSRIQVGGIKTTINFKIAPVNNITGGVISCVSEIIENPSEKFKDINVNCSIASRAKRNILVGGISEQDPKKHEFKKLAEEAMHKFLRSNGKTKPYKIITIDRVTTQVVAGVITRIQFKITEKSNELAVILNCHSEVLEQAWINKKKIKVNCVVDKQSVPQEPIIGGSSKEDNYYRVKRRITGAPLEQNPNDPEYRKLAEESMQKYLQNTGNTVPHTVLDIEKVTTQVVAGKKTVINFKISPVSQGSGDVISCVSDVWEQPWRNFKEINVNCNIDNHSKVKRQIPGGVTKQDPNKPEYRKLAEESMQKYLQNSGNTVPHTVLEIEQVTTQVVAGTKTVINFKISPVSQGSGDVISCVSKIWEQPWRNFKEINVDCIIDNSLRSKRENHPQFSLGGQIEETIHYQYREKRQTGGTEDDYVDEDISFYYADRAIKQLNEQTYSNNLHKLITIHGSQKSMHMDQPIVRMYIETAETYCQRHRDENILPECDELEGMNHQLCLVRIWPSLEDEHTVKVVSLVCEDDEKFEAISGLSIPTLLEASIKEIENSPKFNYKLVLQGEPQVIPTLDSNFPITINFVVATTNCTKNLKADLFSYNCFIDISRPSRACQSRVWLVPKSMKIRKISAECDENVTRKKRAVSLNLSNSTTDEMLIQNLVQESLHKLEMSSSNRYKQKVLQIKDYSSKITSGKLTTINFDVAYTSCLKFEWVDDMKSCEILKHLPKRHCVSQIWERLWIENGRSIEVTCTDDETPLEPELSTESAMRLATEALKHIEAKYPHPLKQKIVRIFSLEKQIVAGIHYRMKLEVGSTNCPALSAGTECKLKKDANNKFCRVNVWLRPWTDHASSFRVSCDYQEAGTGDLYHHLQAEQLFHNFLTTYQPEYIDKPDEMKRKFEIFKANIRKINELNTHEKGTATYGITRFADLSYEEFSQRFLGLKPSLRDTNQVPMRQAQIPRLNIPDKFDWRDHGAVTEVKNQGSCGSCWAFSVTGNIEGQWKMQSGQLVSLSEQELVDCDKLDQGCSGGLPDNAYRAIEQLGGLELEKDYPYEGDDEKCSFNKTMSRVKISGAVNITSNETGMAKWLVQNGPISIGINANAMQFYMGGVSHPWKLLCNPTNLDHGVLIVGYGTKEYPLFNKKLPYWTIKNSWGPEWGEKGYYRVFRGDGTCGVNQMASSAVI